MKVWPMLSEINAYRICQSILLRTTKDYQLKESPYLVLTMRMKEIQVNAGYGALQSVANTLVKPLLQLLKGILTSVETLLDSAVN